MVTPVDRLTLSVLRGVGLRPPSPRVEETVDLSGPTGGVRGQDTSGPTLLLLEFDDVQCGPSGLPGREGRDVGGSSPTE